MEDKRTTGFIRRKRFTLIEEIMEFYEGKNLYQLVRDFHIAFNHPYNDGEPEAISVWQRLSRCKWMMEEVMEYFAAADNDQIEQIDSLVDLLYFILGTYVMIGKDPFDDEALSDLGEYSRQLATMAYENNEGPPAADRLYLGSPMSWRTGEGKKISNLIFSFAIEGELMMQLIVLRKILDWTIKESAIVGGNLEPYFLIVHDHNMQKLWPDGKPRYNSDGKIVKPVGYESPRKQMQNLMVNQINEANDNDDIPF